MIVETLDLVIMTTAAKLNSKKLLSQIADSGNSGCLELDSGSVTWKIYFSQGKIQYVFCSARSLNQLKYYLHYFEWRHSIAAIDSLPSSFADIQNSSSVRDLYSEIISWLLEKNHLELSQVIKLIQFIAKDELMPCLWLESGISVWHENHSLPPWIPLQIRDSLSLDFTEFMGDAQIKLRQWQNCSDKLESVYQRPYFPPSWETKPLPPSGSLNHNTLIKLTQVLMGRTTIRQLSILLKKDELSVAQILSPYIDEKIIYLHHAPTPLSELPCIPRSPEDKESVLSSSDNSAKKSLDGTNTPVKVQKIVCIDDSPTILGEIRRFLDRDRFEITTIEDPIQAVSQIFKINPDLILLDITMPRINGYKLCGLLRSSGKCDNIPIIMVTGNTGFIDKARAKLAGASDYFTKPFTSKGLNEIVAKHLI